MAGAAFFDLDGTLLSVNSGSLWALRERRLGRIDLRTALDAAAMVVLYRLGVVDMEATTRRALALYRGAPEAEIRAMTHAFYTEELAGHVAPGAHAALVAHRAAGEPCVLLTSSSPYLSALVAERLGLDAWLSTIYEVRDGRLTGEPVLPLCFGAGKIHHAERWARGRGLEIQDSTFYTDSNTDVPLLERVGRPRVVNPDLRLRVIAWRRGWPVSNWRKGSPEVKR